MPAIKATIPDSQGWWWVRPSPAHAWRPVWVQSCPGGWEVQEPGRSRSLADYMREYPGAKWSGPIDGPVG